MPDTSEAAWTFKPLTPARWSDLETLFGSRGACGGCWCMTPRLTRSEYERQKGEGNRQALRAIVAGGTVPGILAYHDDAPVGWCAIEPRAAYGSLARSRILKPIDDRPVWSIVCLFVARDRRRQGLSVALLRAAVAHAASRGAELVEGYPTEPRGADMPPAFAWTGLASAFLAAGFSEVARRSPTRPIMRREIPRGATSDPANQGS